MLELIRDFREWRKARKNALDPVRLQTIERLASNYSAQLQASAPTAEALRQVRIGAFALAREWDADARLLVEARI